MPLLQPGTGVLEGSTFTTGPLTASRQTRFLLTWTHDADAGADADARSWPAFVGQRLSNVAVGGGGREGALGPVRGKVICQKSSGRGWSAGGAWGWGSLTERFGGHETDWAWSGNEQQTHPRSGDRPVVSVSWDLYYLWSRAQSPPRFLATRLWPAI